jgi:hypothetical protein
MVAEFNFPISEPEFRWVVTHMLIVGGKDTWLGFKSVVATVVATCPLVPFSEQTLNNCSLPICWEKMPDNIQKWVYVIYS